MTMVYLAHPCGGDESNIKDAEQLVKQLIHKYPERVFLSPLQATGFYYGDISYIEGMKHCVEMLGRCDELWLCKGWQDSKGCCMEWAVATAKKIPIYEVEKML